MGWDGGCSLGKKHFFDGFWRGQLESDRSSRWLLGPSNGVCGGWRHENPGFFPAGPPKGCFMKVFRYLKTPNPIPRDLPKIPSKGIPFGLVEARRES